MPDMVEARLYEKGDKGEVNCSLCAHRCKIPAGKSGICNVRKNIGGVLYTSTYDHIVAANPDPIEKKPLFHFKPGSSSYSVATVGCNFTCSFCQNHNLSQWLKENPDKTPPGQAVSPKEIVADALRHSCASIAFTYTEPTVFFELAYDTAKLASTYDIDSVFVSNGYMTHEAIEAFHPYLKAINIDLKAYSDETYRKVCGGSLEPVLNSIKRFKELGVWVEVTTLIVPGMNDSKKELSDIAKFISSVDPDIPWHVSAFHPDYKMQNLDRTSIDKLHEAWRIGQSAGLHFVYTGNIPSNELESTRCPSCGTNLIRRYGFHSQLVGMREDRCSSCGVKIPGVFSS